MAGGYGVGRGRPPQEHRFKKGRSGNPKGRPKGSKNVSVLVRRMLDATTSSPIDGKRISYRELMLLAQMKKAIEGSLAHATWLLSQDQVQDTGQTQGGIYKGPIEIELDMGEPESPPGGPYRRLE